jgi:hypothetical protein
MIYFFTAAGERVAICAIGLIKHARDSAKILALSLVLPAAEDDLQFTAAGKSALSSCIFIGERVLLCFTISPLIYMYIYVYIFIGERVLL